MWRFVGDEKGLEPIPGLPLEASDEDFAAAVAVYEAQFGDRTFVDEKGETVVLEAAGSVSRSGLYEHISDRRLRREQAEEAATAAAEEG